MAQPSYLRNYPANQVNPCSVCKVPKWDGEYHKECRPDLVHNDPTLRPIINAHPQVVITAYRPYRADDWEKELRFLWTMQSTRYLLADVLNRGILEPIIVSNEGFIMDGHARIAVALALQIDLPVKFHQA